MNQPRKLRTLLVDDESLSRRGLELRLRVANDIEIVGQSMTTDFENSFDGTCKALIGYHMNVAAAQSVYEQSGLGPEDVDVIELHDCFSANELVTYDALRLCAEGGAGEADDVVKQLEARGVRVDGVRVHREDSGYSIYLDDPCGNRIELATSRD